MLYYYHDYAFYGLTVPIVIAIVFLVCAILITFFLHRKKAGIFTQVSPIVGLLCTYILMIYVIYPAFPFLEKLPYDKQKTPITDVVQVTKVETTSAFPVYYVQGWQNAEIIKSNRGEFYCIGTPDVCAGDCLQVTYLPNSRALLEWQNIPEQEAIEYWDANPEPPKVDFQKPNRESGYAAQIIALVVFFICSKDVLIELCKGFLIDKLWEKDTLCSNRIQPRMFGILEKAYDQIVFICATVALFITHSTAFGVLFLFISIGYGYYYCEILSTRVIFAQDHFSFRSISTKLTVGKKEIVRICWESHKNFFGKVLVVYLSNTKSIRFPQMDFVGLKHFIQWCEDIDS